MRAFIRESCANIVGGVVSGLILLAAGVLRGALRLESSWLLAWVLLVVATALLVSRAVFFVRAKKPSPLHEQHLTPRFERRTRLTAIGVSVLAVVATVGTYPFLPQPFSIPPVPVLIVNETSTTVTLDGRHAYFDVVGVDFQRGQSLVRSPLRLHRPNGDSADSIVIASGARISLVGVIEASDPVREYYESGMTGIEIHVPRADGLGDEYNPRWPRFDEEDLPRTAVPIVIE